MRFVLAAGFSAQDRGLHGGVNAYNSVLANAEVSKLLPDGAGFTNLGEKGAAFLLGSHGGPAAGRRPHRRDQRAGYKVARSQFFRESLEIVVR